MNPVERNALLAAPVLDPADMISTLPKEIFVMHILPHLSEGEFSKAQLVSRQWSVITEDFRTSLVHRAHRGNSMTAEQWLIISRKNPDLAALVACLYSLIKRCVDDTPVEGVELSLDALNVSWLFDEISIERKLSSENMELLSLFLDSIFCFCFEKICGIQEWQEAFFNEVFSDNLIMSGLMGAFVKMNINERMQVANSIEELKLTLLDDLNLREREAQMIYAFLCENGNNALQIPKDEKKALEYYKLAVGQGCEVSAYYLGCCYIEGHLVAKDINKAISYFTLVAQKNKMPLFSAVSHSFLAYCYAKGLCGAPDNKKAFKHMQKSAKSGSSVAELYLGFCYASGYGIEQNWEEAFVSLSATAVRWQDPYAYLAAGCCYLGGKGVKQNYGPAAACFKKVWNLCSDQKEFNTAWVARRTA